MKRLANAVWDGRLNEGHGDLTTESGALTHTPYSFATRFGIVAGTNPEELLAAAHAASYSMSLAHELEISNLHATRLEVNSSVRIELGHGEWTIREADLLLKAHLGGAASNPFLFAASRARGSCLVSRLFSARVTLHTELEGQHPGSDSDADVVIYTSSFRQISGQAQALLESKGVHYREVDLDLVSPDVAEGLKQRTGVLTLPQIFVGEHFIGSYMDLIHLDADHGLKALLQPTTALAAQGSARREQDASAPGVSSSG